MSDDTIRAALDAAESAMRQHGLGATREEVAEAIAAFLRALPNGQLLFGATPIRALDGKQAAALIEEAARHE